MGQFSNSVAAHPRTNEIEVTPGRHDEISTYQSREIESSGHSDATLLRRGSNEGKMKEKRGGKERESLPDATPWHF